MLRAGEVASEDATVGVREGWAVCESMREGKVFLLPVTGAEWAEGSIASQGAEAVGVIGMKAMAGDGLEGSGL